MFSLPLNIIILPAKILTRSPTGWACPQRYYVKFYLTYRLSFHTFQAVSYTIEVYRGAQQPERNFWVYALYVLFYPQLVAGPIERPQNLLHQFKMEMRFSKANLLQGIR